jgi:hypothetical protein
MDTILKVTEGANPIELEKLMAIAIVESKDVLAASRAWKKSNPGEFENILEAEAV